MKKNLTTLLFALVAMMMPIGAWAQNAVITGVTITVDGIEYGVGDTAVVTPNTTSLIYTVYGERFANVTSENYISYTQGLEDPLTNGWMIDIEKNTATCDFSNKLHFFEINITPYEVKYSNDNMKTWSQSGVYIVYDYGLSEEEKAVITGVTITVDGVEYGVGDTAVVTPNTTSLIYTVYGERFANVTSENYISYSRGSGDPLTNGWTIDTEKNTATYDFSNALVYFESNITPFEVQYSNDNRVTRVNSGVYIMYDYGLSEEEKAVITGVTITVDGVEYGVGDTAVVAPNTTSLIFTVYGENFANLTSENFITYSQGMGNHLTNGWTIDTEKNTATYDFSNALVYFESNITPFEVQYSNDNRVTRVNSGVYIMYDYGLSEEEKAVITGVTITVDGVEYGVGDTAVVTPNTTSLIFTVYGNNFKNLNANHLLYDGSVAFEVNELNGWVIDDSTNTATHDRSDFLRDYTIMTTPVEIVYTNDRLKTRIESGVYLMYSEQNDEDTSLDQLTHDNQANSHKILRDGQVIILRDGKAYNLMGVAL